MSPKKTFIIGEIGINHNGSIKSKTINFASKNGFDAVKFQKRTPNISTPKDKANVEETPWGKITYLKYKEKLEFNKKQYDEIDRFCKKINIIWFASPWDIESNNFLNKYNLNITKLLLLCLLIQIY